MYTKFPEARRRSTFVTAVHRKFTLSTRHADTSESGDGSRPIVATKFTTRDSRVAVIASVLQRFKVIQARNMWNTVGVHLKSSVKNRCLCCVLLAGWRTKCASGEFICSTTPSVPEEFVVTRVERDRASDYITGRILLVSTRGRCNQSGVSSTRVGWTDASGAWGNCFRFHPAPLFDSEQILLQISQSSLCLITQSKKLHAICPSEN